MVNRECIRCPVLGQATAYAKSSSRTARRAEPGSIPPIAQLVPSGDANGPRLFGRGDAGAMQRLTQNKASPGLPVLHAASWRVPARHRRLPLAVMPVTMVTIFAPPSTVRMNSP
jgi:hypothetical protein